MISYPLAPSFSFLSLGLWATGNILSFNSDPLISLKLFRSSGGSWYLMMQVLAGRNGSCENSVCVCVILCWFLLFFNIEQSQGDRTLWLWWSFQLSSLAVHRCVLWCIWSSSNLSSTNFFLGHNYLHIYRSSHHWYLPSWWLTCVLLLSKMMIYTIAAVVVVVFLLLPRCASQLRQHN